MTILISEEALWQYSLGVYGIERNKQCLLWLQDHANMNINILLSTGYLANCGWVISAQDIAKMFSAIAHLDADTRRLREARRLLALSSGQSNFKLSPAYTAALHAELESEKQQQQAIVQWCGQHRNIFNKQVSASAVEQLTSELIQTVQFFKTYKLDCPAFQNSPKLEPQIEQHIHAISVEFIEFGEN